MTSRYVIAEKDNGIEIAVGYDDDAERFYLEVADTDSPDDDEGIVVVETDALWSLRSLVVGSGYEMPRDVINSLKADEAGWDDEDE